MIPLHWRHGDPAWVRGRRVKILSFYARGGVLVEVVRSGERLLVHRRDLEFVPLPGTRAAAGVM